MDKRQKRLEEGKKKSIDADDDDDEWPDIPPGYNFLVRLSLCGSC